MQNYIFLYDFPDVITTLEWSTIELIISVSYYSADIRHAVVEPAVHCSGWLVGVSHGMRNVLMKYFLLRLPGTNSSNFDISPLVGLTNHDDFDCFRIPARHTENLKWSKIKL